MISQSKTRVFTKMYILFIGTRIMNIINKGPSIKDIGTKLQKIYPCPCPHWLKSFPTCLCRYTINFEKSQVFCTQKCGHPHLRNHLSPPPCLQSVRTGQPPINGRLIWTVHKKSTGLRTAKHDL